MKKRELIRRWGILFLSFMIMSGTASVPSYTVYAGEMDGLRNLNPSRILPRNLIRRL